MNTARECLDRWDSLDSIDADELGRRETVISRVGSVHEFIRVMDHATAGREAILVRPDGSGRTIPVGVFERDWRHVPEARR